MVTSSGLPLSNDRIPVHLGEVLLGYARFRLDGHLQMVNASDDEERARSQAAVANRGWIEEKTEAPAAESSEPARAEADEAPGLAAAREVVLTQLTRAVEHRLHRGDLVNLAASPELSRAARAAAAFVAVLLTRGGEKANHSFRSGHFVRDDLDSQPVKAATDRRAVATPPRSTCVHGVHQAHSATDYNRQTSTGYITYRCPGPVATPTGPADDFETRIEYGHQTDQFGWVPEYRGIKYATHQREVAFRNGPPLLLDHWSDPDGKRKPFDPQPEAPPVPAVQPEER